MYPLNELLFLSISALVSGINDWQSTVIFGEEKLEWLRKFFPYKHGIPSVDTLERLFSALDPVSFETCFRKWVNQISTLTDGEVIAIDGKTMRGYYETHSNLPAKHVVSAYATQAHICLGQELTDQKSNEITAIPQLLNLLALKGCMVSIDAMGCQTKIASTIRKQEAHYLLAVKKNQKDLHQQVEKLFNMGALSSVSIEENIDHGRAESRTYSVINDLTFLDGKEQWIDLQSIVKVKTKCFNKTTKKTTHQNRYYISSADNDAKMFNQQIPSHWAIEYNLHWMLDVSFGEDKSRRRKNNHAINFNIMAKTALGLIKSHPNPKKTPLSHKKRRAILNDSFRERLLGF